MILRNSALRHGRQVMSSRGAFGQSCVRASSTDHRHTRLPTAFADPTPPPPPKPRAGSAGALATKLSSQAPGNSAWQSGSVRLPMDQWRADEMAKKSKVDQTIALNHRTKERIAKSLRGVGAVVTKRFDPRTLLHNPPGPQDVTLELLMASQCHMGHHVSLWNPACQRYIYGVRAGIHIISLEETAAALRRAARVVEEVTYLGGLILFVGNRRGQMEIIARAAELAGACHLFTKWVPGTITNRDQILSRSTVRIVDEKDETLNGFNGHLIERRPLMPDLVVVMNPLENHVLLHECAQENIPTIGLIDTNADPMRVTYTIPGNDDSMRAVALVAGVLGRAGEQGQKRRKADAERGVCTWRNQPDVEAWMLNMAQMEETAEEVAAREEEEAEEKNKGKVDDDL